LMGTSIGTTCPPKPWRRRKWKLGQND